METESGDSGGEDGVRKSSRNRKRVTEPAAALPSVKKKKVNPPTSAKDLKIYIQDPSTVTVKPSSLETIYEDPKRGRVKNVMSSTKYKRCMTEISNFWNPNSKKLKARKVNANKMKKRGVKIPTGIISNEVMESVLSYVSDGSESEMDYLNSTINVNTSVLVRSPKREIVLPTLDDKSAFSRDGIIMPDQSYIESPKSRYVPDNVEELNLPFDEEIVEVKPKKRGRRSNVRDFSGNVHQSLLNFRHEASSKSVSQDEEKCDKKSSVTIEESSSVMVENPNICVESLPSKENVDRVTENFGFYV